MSLSPTKERQQPFLELSVPSAAHSSAFHTRVRRWEVCVSKLVFILRKHFQPAQLAPMPSLVDATKERPTCAQAGNDSSEDCLFVDILTPAVGICVPQFLRTHHSLLLCQFLFGFTEAAEPLEHRAFPMVPFEISSTGDHSLLSVCPTVLDLLVWA